MPQVPARRYAGSNRPLRMHEDGHLTDSSLRSCVDVNIAGFIISPWGQSSVLGKILFALAECPHPRTFSEMEDSK